MKRGPFIHGGLLLVALVFAYLTWTRDTTKKPDVGTIVVWEHPADSFAAITFARKNKELQISWKRAGKEPYLWGQATRYKPKPGAAKDKKNASKNRPKDDSKDAPKDAPKDPSKDAPKDAPKDPSKDALPSPPVEKISDTRYFPLGKAGKEILANFNTLKALRSLGKLDDKKREEFGLLAAKDNLTVSFKGGKQETLVVGSRVYGGSDRYVLHTESDKAYVLSSKVVQPIESGENSLRLKKLHEYEEEDLAKVSLSSKDETKNLLRVTTQDEKGQRKAWTYAEQPDKPDQTLDNFLNRANTLMPTHYESTVEDLEKVITLTYAKQSGNELGYIEFYRKVPPALASGAEPNPEHAEKTEGDTAHPRVKEGEKKPAATTNSLTPASAEPRTKKSGEDAPATKSKKAAVIEYYVRTERTHSFGKISRLVAERFDADVAELFGRAAPPTTPAPKKKKAQRLPSAAKIPRHGTTSGRRVPPARLPASAKSKPPSSSSKP